MPDRLITLYHSKRWNSQKSPDPQSILINPTLVGSFDDYQTPDYLLELISSNLKKPENSLALLNCIRLKRNISQWHVKKYEDLEAETKALLTMIENYLENQ